MEHKRVLFGEDNGGRRTFFLHLPTQRILSCTEMEDEGFATRAANGRQITVEDPYRTFLPLGFYYGGNRAWASAGRFAYYGRQIACYLPVSREGQIDASRAKAWMASGSDLMAVDANASTIMKVVGSDWDMAGGFAETVKHVDMSSEGLDEIKTEIRIVGDAFGVPWMRMALGLPHISGGDPMIKFGVTKDATTGAYLILNWAAIPVERQESNPLLSAADGPLPWESDILKKTIKKGSIALYNQRTGNLGLVNAKGDYVGTERQITSLQFYEPSMLEKTCQQIQKAAK